MWHTIISESVFTGVVLKVLGGATFELVHSHCWRVLQCRNSLQFMWPHVERLWLSLCRDGHHAQGYAHLGGWYMAGFSPCFRDFSRIVSACPFLDGENTI